MASGETSVQHFFLVSGYLSLPLTTVDFSFFFFFFSPRGLITDAPIQDIVHFMINSSFGHKQFVTKLSL